MRDINRIDDFCDRLKGVWKAVPDWRFGQLVMNAFKVQGNPVLFYKEDADTIKLLESYVEGIKYVEQD